MKRIGLIVWWVVVGNWSFAQVLSYPDYIRIVWEQHPQMYRAELAANQGRFLKMKANGAFDPKLAYNLDQKYFDEKNYYLVRSLGLKVPTWLGLSVQTGYDNNRGAFLNPMLNNPNNGLFYAGLDWEVGAGLFTDARRTEWRQARIAAEATQFKQQWMQNDLLFRATVAYFEWAKAQAKLDFVIRTLTNAQLRLDAIRQAAELGDRPYIDTVETTIFVQNRIVDRNQMEMELQNAKLKVEPFLWLEGFLPLEIEGRPMPIDSLQAESWVVTDELKWEDWIENQPYWRMENASLEQLRLDQKLKLEMLKPRLNVKYNVLNEPLNTNPLHDLSLNNYKFQVQASYPLFTRKERGDLNLARIKSQDKELELLSLKAELRSEMKQAYNEWTTSQMQWLMWQDMVKNYNRMYNSEVQLFNLGESSIFLLNSREKSLLDAELKYVDATGDVPKFWAYFYYEIGQLNQVIERQYIAP